MMEHSVRAISLNGYSLVVGWHEHAFCCTDEDLGQHLLSYVAAKLVRVSSREHPQHTTSPCGTSGRPLVNGTRCVVVYRYRTHRRCVRRREVPVHACADVPAIRVRAACATDLPCTMEPPASIFLVSLTLTTQAEPDLKPDA